MYTGPRTRPGVPTVKCSGGFTRGIHQNLLPILSSQKGGFCSADLLLARRRRNFLRLSRGRFFRRLKAMELLTHDELARLTPPERLALISQLWDSLEDNQLP
jgi:hypothetical protein